MILLVDNYDSFTFNLEQYLAEYCEVVVKRNDAPDLLEVAGQADGIVLSPGPGKPGDAGLLETVVTNFAKQKPLLGICLGHQAIGEVFGGEVKQAEKIRHGKVSTMRQTAGAIFAGLPKEMPIMRYHSLIVDKKTLPNVLEVLAVATDDQEVMAMKLKNYPVYGLQFHPESIGTVDGKQMIKNFVTIVERVDGNGKLITQNI
ncbi:anthranilate synthase component II [Listeria ivanovii]|uniref:Aminodeoxychorismate/anthranilate synthase component II n=2 Tax=Listeria ivanovii TaxID=1638 RepID=A0ABS1G4P9_LISIV|nr:aminodeoxychorismate/anthranilate synthase component II [Listeria ivanovii]EFR96730.1 anthranilate synthase component II [Listeria ivanovii FSL F6-596]AIS60040.1 anthranilate synthase subunit II [Listeria ivanovii subsp. londoniensis]AIS62865.1 anthranilate synthase subunit II [Listeria ivanovii subsp. londoniensis]MBK1961842.1 aminodeoxychorismate/anthranilate synthase component II [Listeria ivanovii subsp. londoniensis]MBK1966840.1 aminodeoxychorismate/anthranilate synthase component II [